MKNKKKKINECFFSRYWLYLLIPVLLIALRYVGSDDFLGRYSVRDTAGEKVFLWELGYNSSDTLVREALYSDWENLLIIVEDDSSKIRAVHATYFESSGHNWVRMYEGKTLSGFSPSPKIYPVKGYEVRSVNYDNYKIGPVKK